MSNNQENTKECCEKCWGARTEMNYSSPVPYNDSNPYCKNPSCPCHSEPKEEKFVYMDYAMCSACGNSYKKSEVHHCSLPTQEKSEHFVPDGHKYCQKCGGQYGVDYFENDECGKPFKPKRLEEGVNPKCDYWHNDADSKLKYCPECKKNLFPEVPKWEHEPNCQALKESTLDTVCKCEKIPQWLKDFYTVFSDWLYAKEHKDYMLRTRLINYISSLLDKERHAGIMEGESHSAIGNEFKQFFRKEGHDSYKSTLLEQTGKIKKGHKNQNSGYHIEDLSFGNYTPTQIFNLGVSAVEELIQGK